jgi:flavin reductase (DIM6/NTAB) family NADH-FMN oxidoreductase RutF
LFMLHAQQRREEARSHDSAECRITYGSIPMSPKSEWWRAVLGEYPTGVALITSQNSEGHDVAMLVGTFMAVSQDPPMIGFLPDRSSTTFPHIRANGSFSVSVLGIAHEDLARAFAAKSEDRWETAEWVRAASGAVRVADALIWFDARISTEAEAGDHSLVIGTVNEFGVGDSDPGLPMLFLRGGYGTFAVDVPKRHPGTLHRNLRAVQAARRRIRDLSQSLDAEVVVSAVDHDRVIVLDAVGPGRPDSDHPAAHPMSVTFPLAAPLAPAFVAWAREPVAKAWMELSRHLLGRVDRTQAAQLLTLTRERGYAVAGGSALDGEFLATTSGESSFSELKSLWKHIDEQTTAMLSAPDRLPAEITSIQAPVFDAADEVSLVVTVNKSIGAEELPATSQALLTVTHDLGDIVAAELETA